MVLQGPSRSAPNNESLLAQLLNQDLCEQRLCDRHDRASYDHNRKVNSTSHDGPKAQKRTEVCNEVVGDLEDSILSSSPSRSKSPWTRRGRFFSFTKPHIGMGQRDNCSQLEKGLPPGRKGGSLRLVLRCLAIMLLLLGFVQFVILSLGLIFAFFPDEFTEQIDPWRTRRLEPDLGHWPTDYTADIQPVSCHSHNDYWRKVPLKDAIRAGCTGVEADVWLYGEELFVGHKRSALMPSRTLTNLYVQPLRDILDKENSPTPFHPAPDTVRNGVFDTDPEQTLVLLIDFKTNGEELWPVVSAKLEPLRQARYLTYFNGSATVPGPVTVVVTGNAPFTKAVANSEYRDMFFDAPLDLMDTVDTSALPTSWFDLSEERAHLSHVGDAHEDASNQGQGRSGAAPMSPLVYSPANSYYASVSFKTSIGVPLPYLTRAQRHKIRQQIAGAHALGLKVRYWDTPSWPRGLRNYLWRVLVREGADYINVDDLKAATHGEWRAGHKVGWGKHGWTIWRGGWGRESWNE